MDLIDQSSCYRWILSFGTFVQDVFRFDGLFGLVVIDYLERWFVIVRLMSSSWEFMACNDISVGILGRNENFIPGFWY